MANWRIERIKDFLIKKTEDIYFSSRTNCRNNNDILLLRLDKLGDYILFRNFIEEVHKFHHTSGKLILCGNIIWKELAEKLDGEFISEFIWVDVPKLEDYSYRFSVYKKIRDARCNKLIYCAYSRTAQGDNLALHSGAAEIIGYNGDIINMPAEKKKRNDKKYTMLVPSLEDCMFEFYRNKIFFEYIFKAKIALNKPFIKTHPLEKGVKNQYILIFPGASHEFKRWSTLNYATLCISLFQQYKIQVLLCGAENEKQFTGDIKAKSGSFVEDCAGKYSLLETVELIQQAALVVTNDTGPLHIAMALRIAAICVFNGNLYERFCPYPKEMGMPLTVVLPDEFEMKISESNHSMSCKGSEIDINLITPHKVLDAIHANNLINYA